MEFDSETSKSINLDLKHSCDVDINNVEIPNIEFSFDQVINTFDNNDFAFDIINGDQSTSRKSTKAYSFEMPEVQLVNIFNTEIDSKFYLAENFKTGEEHETDIKNNDCRMDFQNAAHVFTENSEFDDNSCVNISDLNPDRKNSEDVINISDIIESTEYKPKSTDAIDKDYINKMFSDNMKELNVQTFFPDIIYEESLEEDGDSNVSWVCNKDSMSHQGNLLDNLTETGGKYKKVTSIDYCNTKNDTNSNGEFFEPLKTNISDSQVSNQFTSNKIEELLRESDRSTKQCSGQFCNSYMGSFLSFLIPCIPINKKHLS